MRLYQRLACLSASLLLLFAVNPLWAKNSLVTEQVQLPQCLANQLPQNYKALAENKSFKIIELPINDIVKLARLADEVACGRFINLSHRFTNPSTKEQTARAILANQILKVRRLDAGNYVINHQEAVQLALAKVDSNNLLQTLARLSSFYNRSATQQDGVAAAEWLKAQFESLAQHYGRQDTAAYFVATGTRYLQPSLVTVIGKDIKAPALVIGAHMDTLDGRMPGAGDDASGSAVVLEMTRVLFEAQANFKRPIYIIWYAAEERGLVGSQYVVREFINQSIPVKAAIQFDMAGYRSKNSDPTMWVFRDYTDEPLSDFVAELIKTYIKVPVAYSSCGYGCSDHASWMAEGIPAAFPCETSFAEHNPFIHSAADTINLINTEHLTNFAKLAVAFAVELASD